ncbi:hypothetical protein ACK8P5_25235 [Paenibacillus sp. EC2-1]|uniref:hypothetical protein n=1 Tax=Paenibacillus sp. EC2-1 TaxID=3388665 RepID=UPI003BEEF603
MSNSIKQAIEEIPIPEMLHERGLMGIYQAKEECDAALTTPMKNKPIKRRMVAASIIVVLSMSAAVIFNPHLSAAIQRALQFIPGIGVIQKADGSSDSYMLTEPIDIKNSNQTGAFVTAMLVQKDLTTIEMNVYPNYSYDIRIKDESGKVHKASSSHTYGGDDFSHVTLKFAGQVDVKEQAQLFFLDRPDEVFTIPLSKVDSIDTLNAIGESVEVHDLEITAIPTPAGHKGRIFLNTEHSNPFRYYDSFPEKGDLIILNENISVTDELGNDYPIDNKGIRMPFKDIYFNLGSSDIKKYTLTIPQLISVGREEINVSINIPDGEEGPLNQSFNIAGYPVELTKFKKSKTRFNEDHIAIYVEMPNPLQLSRSLKYFYVSTDSSIENGGAYDSTTGVMKFFEAKYDPSSSKLNFKITKPMIDMKGPWKFEIDADKFR